MGFTISLGFNFIEKSFYLNLENKHSYTVSLGKDSSGNIIRIDNELGRISSYLENHKNKLTTLKQQYDVAKREVEKPFAQEEELKEKNKRLNELNARLNLNKKEIIEYVVFYEFCKLKINKSSKKFNETLNKYIPNYENSINLQHSLNNVFPAFYVGLIISLCMVIAYFIIDKKIKD